MQTTTAEVIDLEYTVQRIVRHVGSGKNIWYAERLWDLVDFPKRGTRLMVTGI